MFYLLTVNKDLFFSILGLIPYTPKNAIVALTE
jgi:hypothetical protein